MGCKQAAEWSKSWKYRPKDHLISNIYLNSPTFKASFEKEKGVGPSMALLLSWEYSRIWQREHLEFLKRRLQKEKLKKVSDPLAKVKKRMAENKEKQKRIAREKEIINEKLRKASERAKKKAKLAESKKAEEEKNLED